jgi:imidazoleglycerol phosphate dehydratase HisB
MRSAEVNRKTKETDISVFMAFEGSGTVESSTGLPFFDHMLTSMARHGGFDLIIRAEGDLEVDSHHTVEDTGIVIGEVIRKIVGEGRGIRRFSHAIVPMDEALATVAMDCSGRGFLIYQGCFTHKTIGMIQPLLKSRLERPYHVSWKKRSSPVRGTLQGFWYCPWRSSSNTTRQDRYSQHQGSALNRYSQAYRLCVPSLESASSAACFTRISSSKHALKRGSTALLSPSLPRTSAAATLISLSSELRNIRIRSNEGISVGPFME